MHFEAGGASCEWEEAYQARQKMNTCYLALYTKQEALDPTAAFRSLTTSLAGEHPHIGKPLDMQAIHENAEAAYAHAPKTKAYLDKELQTFAEQEGLAVQTETEAEACEFSTASVMLVPIKEETHEDRYALYMLSLILVSIRLIFSCRASLLQSVLV